MWLCIWTRRPFWWILEKTSTLRRGHRKRDYPQDEGNHAGTLWRTACDLQAIYEIADRHNLPVIEDAAHAIGTSYHGKKIGADALQDDFPNLRRVTVFSFYATKNMTTSEGGMVTTLNTELADRMRLWSMHGMSHDAWKRYTDAGSWYYQVVLPGYKYNMTDIQAALGIHQLRKLDGFVKLRQDYASLYDANFAGLEQLQETPVTHTNRNHVYHLYVIRLDPG